MENDDLKKEQEELDELLEMSKDVQSSVEIIKKLLRIIGIIIILSLIVLFFIYRQ